MTLVITILASDNARNRRRAKRAAEREANRPVAVCRDRVEQALRAPNWRIKAESESGASCLPEVDLYKTDKKRKPVNPNHIVK